MTANRDGHATQIARLLKSSELSLLVTYGLGEGLLFLSKVFPTIKAPFDKTELATALLLLVYMRLARMHQSVTSERRVPT